MIRRVWVCATVGMLVLAGCGDDGGVPAVRDEVHVSDVWARPTAAGVANAAVYMLLESPVDDQLTSVTLDPGIAARATLHETMTMDDSGHHDHGSDDDHGDDMTSMAPLDALALPANSDVELEPGGLHIMLEDLAAPLTVGQSFLITLMFDAAPALTVAVEVRDG